MRYPGPSRDAAFAGWRAERRYKTWNFGFKYAVVTAVTMIAYTWFTVRTTAWRYPLFPCEETLSAHSIF